jgi:hypothetical protein
LISPSPTTGCGASLKILGTIHLQLPELVKTGDALRFRPGSAQRRQKEARKNGDDAEDPQQFDQRKAKGG